jgi:hypothetical protein
MLPLEFRFHDHLDLVLVAVDLLSIPCGLWHPSHPRVLFYYASESMRNLCDLCEGRPHRRCLAWPSVP